MDLSNKEKCLIATLLLTLFVFGNYFFDAIYLYRLDNAVAINLEAVIRVIVFLIIFEIIIHSFFAISDNPEVEDERDKLIEKVSYRNGYWVMSIGVWFLLGQLFVSAVLNPEQYGISNWLNSATDLLSPYVLGNVLLFIFILSEVTVFISQLFYYRRGV